jgi:hypothetical protein
MVQLKWLATLVLFLIVVQPSFADDRAKILGIWKIVSYEWETQATGVREPIMGKNPTGYIIFTPEWRMMVIITGEGRKAPKTDQDRADLLKSMSAYTGMYRLEGDKWITKVDVAWSPLRVGTEQVRFFRFDDDRLQVISAWMPPGTGTERGMGRVIITWERAK